MKKLGLLALVMCFLAASQSRPAEKKETPKPLEANAFEIVLTNADPGRPSEAKKVQTLSIIQAGNSWRVDTVFEIKSDQGDNTKLVSTRIIKDGFRYTFSTDDSSKQSTKCKEYKSKDAEIMEEILGRTWYAAPGKDTPKLTEGGTETAKMPDEKWNNLEMSVFKIRHKNDGPYNYCLVYVDNTGQVRRELWYAPAKDGKSAFLQTEINVIKYETGKTVDKNLFEIPPGFEVVYGGGCANY
jgi:hypothetical protein